MIGHPFTLSYISNTKFQKQELLMNVLSPTKTDLLTSTLIEMPRISSYKLSLRHQGICSMKGKFIFFNQKMHFPLKKYTSVIQSNSPSLSFKEAALTDFCWGQVSGHLTSQSPIINLLLAYSVCLLFCEGQVLYGHNLRLFRASPP